MATRNYVIGTAGHVDHGKSSLIRRLTGIDPDRLAEERRRGLTIDLGFASLQLPNGVTVGIVDVPGHARFIPNMLAGVHGMDAVLLVVAADEGVMPQTREHLDIVDLLDIRRGLVVLTKTDLVDDEWRELVEEDIAKTLIGTSLAGARIQPISVVTGEGIDAFLVQLVALLADMPGRHDAGRPRLPVDRVFTMDGFGTVVTGTLIDGSLRPEDMELQPSGKRVRVRSLQQYGNAVGVALPGTRTAANLVGVEKGDVTRGEVLAHAGTLSPTRRIDVSARVLDDAPGPLRHAAELVLHIGTAEVGCRAVVLGADEIKRGDTGWVQLYLARPVAVAVGDRFVLRRSSPSSTVAGGTLVNAAARRHRRLDPEVTTSLARRFAGNAVAEELRNHPLGITERDLQKVIGADPIAVTTLDARRAGQWLFAPEAWEAVTARAKSMLAAYHREHPLRAGMPRGEFASRMGVPPAVLPFLVEDGVMVEEGREVRDAAHRPELGDADQAHADSLVQILGTLPFAPPSLPEAMRQSGADAEVLRVLIERGRVVRLSEDVAFTAEAYAQALAQVSELIGRDGSASVGTVRDRLGASRRPVLALLDHLDREHITRRVDDVRVLR